MSAPTPRKSPLAAWLALALVLAVLPAAEAAAQNAAAASSKSAARYRIGARDVLRIAVEEAPTLPPEYTVGEDGNIGLEPIGKVKAEGLTEDELKVAIQGLLMKQGLRKATVTVTVTAFRSRPVLVLGAVITPGNQTTSGSTRLMEVLLAAGGLAPEHGPTVQVRRQADNGLSDQVTVEVEDLIETLDPDVNLPIFAGDVIHVASARPLVVHLLGAVKTVGSLTFKNTDRVSVLTAVARAGGLADTASRKIAIKRKDPQTGRLDEKLVDFRRILDGKDPDVDLQDGDVLVAKESFF
jgi:polysaccharide export outer membrane protein